MLIFPKSVQNGIILVHFPNPPPLFYPFKPQKSIFFTGNWKLLTKNCFGPHPRLNAKNQGVQKNFLKIGPFFPKNGPIWTDARTFGPFPIFTQFASICFGAEI